MFYPQRAHCFFTPRNIGYLSLLQPQTQPAVIAIHLVSRYPGKGNPSLKGS